MIINTKFECEHGSFMVVKYTANLESENAKSGLIYDIYFNIPKFSKDICLITDMSVNEDSKMEDVLNDFFASESYDSEAIYVARCGILRVATKPSMTLQEATILRNEENSALRVSGFDNIVWSIRMHRTSNFTDYCIYHKDAGKKFIDEYGPNSNNEIQLIAKTYCFDHNS